MRFLEYLSGPEEAHHLFNFLPDGALVIPQVIGPVEALQSSIDWAWRSTPIGHFGFSKISVVFLKLYSSRCSLKLWITSADGDDLRVGVPETLSRRYILTDGPDCWWFSPIRWRTFYCYKRCRWIDEFFAWLRGYFLLSCCRSNPICDSVTRVDSCGVFIGQVLFPGRPLWCEPQLTRLSCHRHCWPPPQ